jgi:hypothetical protein
MELECLEHLVKYDSSLEIATVHSDLGENAPESKSSDTISLH